MLYRIHRRICSARLFMGVAGLVLLAGICQDAFAHKNKKWGYASLYWGQATDSRLVEIAISDQFIDTYLMALAIGKSLWNVNDKLSLETEFQFVKHFGKEFGCETEACQTYADQMEGDYRDKQDHEEFNVVLVLRWHEFPWNHVIATTFAVGEGVSYATEVPPIEKNYHKRNFGLEDNASRWLNYLLFEFAFSLPEMRDWDLFVRIHHRSGIFGLFNGVNGGSNFVGFGIRYHL